MRLLANENIPLASVRRLRALKHDVLAVAETMPGSSDVEVLHLAGDERRIVLTFDRDYGELIFVRNLPCPAGVIFLRFAPATPEEAADRLSPLLEDEQFAVGHFLVVDRDGVRRRPLPSAGQ